MPETPLKYIMGQLSIKASDWQALSEKDREDLKRHAAEEQKALGL